MSQLLPVACVLTVVDVVVVVVFVVVVVVAVVVVVLLIALYSAVLRTQSYRHYALKFSYRKRHDTLLIL